jgi:signal transduction histidine kinase
MNWTGSKESTADVESYKPRVLEKIDVGLLAGGKRVAMLGTADPALAQRLAREMDKSVPRSAIVLVSGLVQLRELLTTRAPRVIFLDSDLLGGLPLLDSVRQFASLAPVLLLASLNAQADVAKLVADERVDFIARVGDFVPLASALIARRLKQPPTSQSTLSMPSEQTPSGMGEIFRHEINNLLTGILGNAELVLAHREHFSGVEIQRLQTVVDLAVRLRENIRRISNAWESNVPPKAS